MDINIKKTKNGENMYVFCFVDDVDKDSWFLEVGNAVNSLHQSYEYYKEIFQKLKDRINNKYANEEYEYSAILFEEEFLTFVKAIIICAVEYNNKMDSLKKFFDFIEEENRFDEATD